LKKLSENYPQEVKDVLQHKKELPKTNVAGIDIIIGYLQNQCIKNNIDFDLKVNCSVNCMIQNHISENDLETLVSDHVKDAIIAVNNSTRDYKCICATFNIIDDCYEFSVYDSGIEFEIDTLVKLGLEPVTTHADTGGSGLGFFTTFQTLDKYNASLIIEELEFHHSNFSKKVSFRFDTQKEYVIRTRRSEDIQNADVESRIILHAL